MLPAALATRAAATPVDAPPSGRPLIFDAALDSVDPAALLDSKPDGLAAWPCSAASYEVSQLLGHGSFSVVFRARRTSAWEPPMDVALKVTPRKGTERSRELECQLLLRDAPHVCPRLLEYFYVMSPSACHLVMAMEACASQTLEPTRRPP
jgi:serine/threonine protein kinase